MPLSALFGHALEIAKGAINAKYTVTVLGRIATGNDAIVFFLKDDMSKSNLHQSREWNSFEAMLKTASSSNGFLCGVVLNENSRLPRSREKVYYSPYHESEKVFKFSLAKYRMMV